MFATVATDTLTCLSMLVNAVRMMQTVVLPASSKTFVEELPSVTLTTATTKQKCYEQSILSNNHIIVALAYPSTGFHLGIFVWGRSLGERKAPNLRLRGQNILNQRHNIESNISFLL